MFSIERIHNAVSTKPTTISTTTQATTTKTMATAVLSASTTASIPATSTYANDDAHVQNTRPVSQRPKTFGASRLDGCQLHAAPATTQLCRKALCPLWPIHPSETKYYCHVSKAKVSKIKRALARVSGSQSINTLAR